MLAMQAEEFDLLADAVRLYDRARTALRLGCVEGLTEAEIAAALRLSGPAVRQLLAEAERAFAGYQCPESEWAHWREVLDAMRAHPPHCPRTPEFRRSEYDGTLQPVRARSPLVSPDDFVGHWRR